MTRSTRLVRFAGSSVAACRIPAVRAVGASVLALAVSCSDGPTVTGVPAKSPGASLVSAHQGPVVSDVVVMHRSTQIAAHDGVPRKNKSFTEKIGGRVRAVRKEDSELPGTTGPDFGAGELPRPVVSLPARWETGICSALPIWSRAERSAAGGTVLLSGTGDGPASVVKIKAEDGTLLTVERTWVRTSRTWQLARQVTTTADKRYRDEVVYEHQSGSGERIDRALPVVACAGARGPGISPAVASHSFYAPHATSLASRLFPLNEGVSAVYSCGGDCFAEQNSVYVADAALVGAATVAAYACTYVAVVLPAACLAAGVAWAIAVTNLAFAQRALNHCLYMLNQLAVVPFRSPGAIAVAGSLAFGDAAGRASRVFDTPPIISADCSGGGSSDGGSTSCHYEEWEISYDGGSTWSWLASLLVCM